MVGAARMEPASQLLLGRAPHAELSLVTRALAASSSVSVGRLLGAASAPQVLAASGPSKPSSCAGGERARFPRTFVCSARSSRSASESEMREALRVKEVCLSGVGGCARHESGEGREQGKRPGRKRRDERGRCARARGRECGA